MNYPDRGEREIIANQLGREADNLGGIARYCPRGKPAVLLTLPYSKEKWVFPTTYWLSCPYLVKEVSRLEDEGLIGELTQLLKTDEGFRLKLEKAHKRYARKRFSHLKEEDIEALKGESPAILEVLRESGVGGIREKAGIKCLHTHLADFLVEGENPVGEVVWQRLSWPEDCTICQTEDNHNENHNEYRKG
ncbi:MAG: uncharacterized protein PWR10_1650 [Halanaerobiales bacterium]|nr:uncharacterized protein [Halanaerobiales bacterium]